MKPNLVELLEELQRELRLQDWRIEVSYVPDLRSSDGHPVHGLCSHVVDAKVARIAIRDPDTPVGPEDPSVEETLIHELVHLHFAPFSSRSPTEIAVEEQAVWALTEALTNAKNEARRGLIARAMRAHQTWFSAGGRQTRKERYSMDLEKLIAALRAALSADDPKAQIEALLKELEGAVGDGEGAPPDAQKAPPAATADEPPRKAESARERRPADTSATTATTAAQAAKVASAIVTRAEFERYRVDQYLEQNGRHLTEAQRAWASTLSFEQVRAYLAHHPVDPPTPSAPRNPSPARGEWTERRGLPEAERKQLAAAMGLRDRTIGGPRLLEDGRLEIRTARPRDLPLIEQAAKAGKVS